MSTEHQQYSTNNQMDVIQYAKRRGIEIVTEYSDEVKAELNHQEARFASRIYLF